MNNGNQGRRPDYKVEVFDRDTNQHGPIGVAWLNQNGTVSIRFNPCVVIDTTVQNLSVLLVPFLAEMPKPVVGESDGRRDGRPGAVPNQPPQPRR